MTVEHKGLYSHLFEGVPKHWDLYCLSDAVDFQEGPGILAVDFHESGVPLLRLSSIVDKKTTFDGCNFLDPEKVEKKWSHFKLAAGDILLSTSGSLGRVSEVAEPQAGSICYTGIIRFRPKIKSLRYSFIKYFLQSGFFGKQASASAAGSVLKHFGPSHLKQMTFPMPSEREQEEIERLLTPIDDKIDLNRRINQTLEAMAQAIFKSWFVDFDPVKAKIAAIEQGEDPLRAAMRAISGKTDAELDQLPREHHDQLAATAALFPDAMEESALGEIPKGWGIQPLDRIATYLNGLALQKFPPESESEFLPVIKIAQLRAGNTKGADRASARLKSEYIVEDGDVLFSWSGSLEVDVWTGGLGALNQHLFKVTSSHVPKWFYFFATKYYLPQFREIAANKATTMGHIQRKHLSDAQIAVPKLDVMRAASEVIAPIFSQAIALRLQSRQLAELRDTLLPALLSGELSVADLDKEAALP